MRTSPVREASALGRSAWNAYVYNVSYRTGNLGLLLAYFWLFSAQFCGILPPAGAVPVSACNQFLAVSNMSPERHCLPMATAASHRLRRRPMTLADMLLQARTWMARTLQAATAH